MEIFSLSTVIMESRKRTYEATKNGNGFFGEITEIDERKVILNGSEKRNDLPVNFN